MNKLRKVIDVKVNNKPVKKTIKPIKIESDVKTDPIEVIVDTKTDEEAIDLISTGEEMNDNDSKEINLEDIDSDSKPTRRKNKKRRYTNKDN